MLIFILFASVLLGLGYIYLIHWISNGWKSCPNSVANDDHHDTDTLGVSIIIAARNESKSIVACIESILKNDYPHHNYEIIVVDDHSNDKTFEIVSSSQTKNVKAYKLDNGMTGKKPAISFGISKSSHSIILCTDADSVVGTKWISSHVKNYTTDGIKICTGLVLPAVDGTLLSRFQWLDFAATMAITANGIFRQQYYLCNGANMSYLKSTFNEVNGYSAHSHLASGDDVFLMQNITAQFKNAATFIKSKDAIVETKSESTWTAFYRQRKRWASKSRHDSNREIAMIQSYVFMFSLTIMIYLLFGWLITPILTYVGIVLLLIKMATDYLFLKNLAYHFGQPEVIKSFIPAFFVYFIHILLSGWHAIFPSRYLWKDREVS